MPKFLSGGSLGTLVDVQETCKEQTNTAEVFYHPLNVDRGPQRKYTYY